MICRQLAVYGAFTCLFTTVLAAPHLATPGANQPDGNSSRAITVEQAIGLALAHNPLVSANDATVRAAVGRERQAAAYPNPELELEVEDVGLGAAGDDFATSIYTVRLGQTFELGGKREARRRLAALQRELVGRETAIAEADLVAAVKAGFYELLTTQERVRALRTQRKLATEIRDTVAERVRSGKVSPVALTKAEVKLAGAEIDLRRAERTLAIARASLGSLWHASPEESAELEGSGSLQELPTLPALATLREQLDKSPDWAQGESIESLAEAASANEKAARVPDLTVTVGVAHERGSREEVAEFAIALPLPLFDRNQGNIAAARAEADKARAEVRGARLRLTTELCRSWQQAQSSLDEVDALQNTMLPGARKAFGSAEEAYRRGKLDYLDLLDAQQTLFDVEMRHIEALAEVHASVIIVQRLTSHWTTDLKQDQEELR